MKVKLQNIIESKEAIQHLMDQHLPVIAAFRLQKTLRIVVENEQDFEKARVSLVDQLGVPNPEYPTSKTIPPEKMDEFVSRLKELLDEEVELRVTKIPLSTIASADLSVRDVLLLDYLIEEDVHDVPDGS